MTRIRYRDDGLGEMHDGDILRVRMTMMDSLDAIQREVASDFVADRPRVRAFDGSNAGLHRPGVRFADERQFDPLVLQGNARDRALLYQMYDAEKANEFRGVPDTNYYRGGAGELRGSRPGDPCTLNGYPGTLVEEDGKLVCRIKGRTDDAAMAAYARGEDPDDEEEEEEESGKKKGRTARQDVRSKRKEEWEEENEDDPGHDDDKDCNRDAHYGLACPHCGGSGFAPGHRQSGWQTSGKEVVDAVQRATATNHESNVRRDVPDEQTLHKMLDQKNKAMDAFHATEGEQFRKALRGE